MKRTIILAASLLCLTALPAAAQLALAPTFVYIDSPDRFGSLVVTNGSTNEQEVEVSFAFGYPSVDSLGRRFIQYEDSAVAREFELSPWIRSFPERFRIVPGRRQVIRMMIQPPPDLADGVYWTRMTVTSREEADDADLRPGMNARVDFEMKQVISVVYRKGRQTTGARVADLKAAWSGTGMDLLAIFERDGEVPFFGTATLQLLDSTGVPVKEIATSTEVYFSSSTHFRLEDVPAGKYVVDVALTPRRQDVPKGRLPYMDPITRRFTLQIPEASTDVAHAR